MALPIGTRLGSFEIVSLLGAGGMGEVYRAHDTKLGRDVALKILPDSVAANPERVARFEREAKVLAALNHPHVAALYGMEESGNRHFLLMELVEGKTLAERLAEGRSADIPHADASSPAGPGATGRGLPVEEALAIARQILEALEAAHEKGIVHRDLKPANIKITYDGVVKVLDFGLARALDPQSGDAVAPASADVSPTLSALATQAGVILGTAAYMAPEQAKGLSADRRSDLFSFGVVLYEMLAGRAPFQGETAADVLASVVAREANLALLPSGLDPRLIELLQRCLEKNPRRRWQTATDLRADLDAVARVPRVQAAAAPAAGHTAPRSRLALAAALGAAAAATLTLGSLWMFRGTPESPPPGLPARFSVPLGEGQQFTNTGRRVVAISPDGSRIVYVANSRLYLRALNDLEARPIPGTDVWGAVTEPVFSPDGVSIAFWAQSDGTLKKIGVNGGTAITLAAAANPLGMSWGPDGLVYGNPGGIMRVSPSGGRPEVIVQVKDGEVAHGPQVVASGEAVLFTLATGNDVDRWNTAQIVVQSIRSGDRHVLLSGGSDARYLPTGHLVYATEGVLFAVPFDPAELALVGSGTPVIEGVRRPPAGTLLASGGAHFSVSGSGSLVYLPGAVRTASAQRDLAQISRGIEVAVPLRLPPGLYLNPRYSPDGTRLAFDLNEGKAATVAIYDLSGATALRRLTLTGANRFPIWSPDSTRIAYQSDREGDHGIFWQRADGSGAVERLTKAEPGTSHVPDGWSPDGQTLVFEILKDGVFSLWTLSLQDRKVERFGEVESREAIDAVFAPNGRWVAYDAGEGQATRVYVEPFPRTGARYLATNARGLNPFWSPTGTELLYAPTADQFAAVTFTSQPSVAFGNPVSVPRVGLSAVTSAARRTYDMSPDGKRIVSVIEAATTSLTSITPTIQVVLNWFEELKARVPPAPSR